MFSSNNNPRSIQRHLSSAKGFFKFLKKNLVIESSPFELVKAPKTPQHLPDVLSPEDVEQLLSLKPVDALEIRDLAIVELMYSSGLRVSETANINMSDFGYKAAPSLQTQKQTSPLRHRLTSRRYR